MQYHEDLYGIQVDEEAFRENESATTGALAERLMDVIDVDLGGFYSESRGGVCYKSSYDEEIDVLIAPNHVVERDDE